MGRAVCLGCGALKAGAWASCPECCAAPDTPEERARALAASDAYLDPHALAALRAAVGTGGEVALDPEHLVLARRDLERDDPVRAGVLAFWVALPPVIGFCALLLGLAWALATL